MYSFIAIIIINNMHIIRKKIINLIIIYKAKFPHLNKFIFLFKFINLIKFFTRKQIPHYEIFNKYNLNIFLKNNEL